MSFSQENSDRRFNQMPTSQVPSVVGLSRDAALSAFLQAGLVVGEETRVISGAPVNTVTRTIPVAATDMPQGSKVDVDISIGLRTQKWWENTSSFIFSVLGIVTLLALIVVISVGFFIPNGPLELLGTLEIARGIITFLIAFTTVGIAVILTISTVVLQDSPENDKRFDRGKQVLTVLIGVLGTIVGFYFAGSQGASAPALSITSTALTNGAVGSKYNDTPLAESGGTPPFKWSVTPGLPNGLSLAENGVLSGTPTETVDGKTYTFTVVDGNSKSSSKVLKLSIAPGQSSQPAPKSP
jgi:hypothetical protein